MRVMSPQDEVDGLVAQSSARLAQAMQSMARATIDGSQVKRDRALRRTAGLIGRMQALADLTGRRRLLLEASAVRRNVPMVLQDTMVFADGSESMLIPAVQFEERFGDIISREPRLADSARDVISLYEGSHSFALARAADIHVTKRVQRALASNQGRESAEAAIRAIGPFSRAYAATVYRTNLATAYEAGREMQARSPGVSRVMGAFKLTSVHDSAVRRGRPKDHGENHLAASGLIAGVSDPIWERFSPPLGYSCRCRRRLVSKVELRRLGLLDGNVVRRLEPPNFSQARVHPGFGHRASRTIYRTL